MTRTQIYREVENIISRSTEADAKVLSNLLELSKNDNHRIACAENVNMRWHKNQ